MDSKQHMQAAVNLQYPPISPLSLREEGWGEGSAFAFKYRPHVRSKLLFYSADSAVLICTNSKGSEAVGKFL